MHKCNAPDSQRNPCIAHRIASRKHSEATLPARVGSIVRPAGGGAPLARSAQQARRSGHPGSQPQRQQAARQRPCAARAQRASRGRRWASGSPRPTHCRTRSSRQPRTAALSWDIHRRSARGICSCGRALSGRNHVMDAPSGVKASSPALGEPPRAGDAKQDRVLEVF